MIDKITQFTRSEFERWIEAQKWLLLSCDEVNSLYLTPAGVIICVTVNGNEVIFQGKGDYITKEFSLRKVKA